MGNCCVSKNNKKWFGVIHKEKQYYFNKTFMECDINQEIKNLYKDSGFSEWLVYKKGIVAWNLKKISWMIHSIPSFPQVFQGDIISEIDQEELKNQHSFQYIEIDHTLDRLRDIIYQLYFMNVKIYISKNKVTFLKPNIKTNMNMITLTHDIQHLAKSPEYNFDIKKYVSETYNNYWVGDTISGFIFNDPELNRIQFIKN
jgi:hypothetical protein